MTRPLDNIVALQSALTRLQDAEQLLEGIPDWMEELHEEYSERKQQIDACEQVAEEAARERREAEAEIADTQEKLARYQQQMNAVTNQREYSALLQEIDSAKTRIEELQQAVASAIERKDEADVKSTEEREAFADLEQRYKTELEKWESQKPSIGAEVETLRGQIEVYRERLSPQHLASFKRIFDRLNGQALAPIRKVEPGGRRQAFWHCGVCHYNVRPQIVMDVRASGALVQCDACKRLLFVEEEEVAVEEEVVS